MRPDKSCILEATVDLSSPGTTINCKTMPSGMTLLTLASSDKSFECHLDVGAAASAAIMISPKTGGPLVRISDAEENVVATLVLPKDRAAEFGAIRASLGDVVRLSGGAGIGKGGGGVSEVDTACRLVTGEELEFELQDSEAGPMVLDCFARWCGPCQLMEPVMDEVAARLNGGGGGGGGGDSERAACRVLKMDTDEFPDLSEMLRVQGLPTVLFIGPPEEGGGGPLKVLHRFEGAAPADYIVGLAEHYLYGSGPAPTNPLQDNDSC